MDSVKHNQELDIETDPMVLMKEQIQKTKEQYLNLIQSGKVKDPKRKEALEQIILQLD